MLLADDHEAMLDRVARLLATECTVVGTVTDGQQALEAAQDLKPDVLVLDISMPVMNGIETAHRLKKAGVEMRIVFLIRYNIAHAEPMLADKPPEITLSLERASDLALILAYVVSVCLYIRILATFVLGCKRR